MAVKSFKLVENGVFQEEGQSLLVTLHSIVVHTETCQAHVHSIHVLYMYTIHVSIIVCGVHCTCDTNSQ